MCSTCARAVTLVLVVLATLLSPGRTALAADAGPAIGVGAAARLSVDLGSVDRRQGARRFWVNDKHRYRSPWYAGFHRTMVTYGCTSAPYYDPDPRCGGGRGFHHGLDVAMPCGTRLFAAYRTRVVGPASSGALGPAYGAHAFRLRSGRFKKDFAIGHVRHMYVEAGDVVRRGQLVARASDAGAPDGCHLHFEVRPQGAGYQGAVRPYAHIKLRRAD